MVPSSGLALAGASRLGRYAPLPSIPDAESGLGAVDPGHTLAGALPPSKTAAATPYEAHPTPRAHAVEMFAPTLLLPPPPEVDSAPHPDEDGGGGGDDIEGGVRRGAGSTGAPPGANFCTGATVPGDTASLASNPRTDHADTAGTIPSSQVEANPGAPDGVSVHWLATGFLDQLGDADLPCSNFDIVRV